MGPWGGSHRCGVLRRGLLCGRLRPGAREPSSARSRFRDPPRLSLALPLPLGQCQGHLRGLRHGATRPGTRLAPQATPPPCGGAGACQIGQGGERPPRTPLRTGVHARGRPGHAWRGEAPCPAGVARSSRSLGSHRRAGATPRRQRRGRWTRRTRCTAGPIRCWRARPAGGCRRHQGRRRHGQWRSWAGWRRLSGQGAARRLALCLLCGVSLFRTDSRVFQVRR